MGNNDWYLHVANERKRYQRRDITHDDLPFFIEKIRPEKNEKLVYKFDDKKEYV